MIYIENCTFAANQKFVVTIPLQIENESLIMIREDFDNSAKNPIDFGFWLYKSLPSLTTRNLLILLLLLCVLYKIWSRLCLNRRLPPGPMGLPVVGVLPFLRHKPYLTIQNWWEKHGDVFSLYMGQRLCIVVNGIETMKECFVRQSDVFGDRPWNFFKKITQSKGLVFSDGKPWQEHRRFALGCMRDFGMGKVKLEDKIFEEVQYLLQEFDKMDGRPFDPAPMVPKAVSNIISSIIYGSRFDYEDPVFKASIDALEQSVRMQSMVEMIQFIPFLEILPKILPRNKLLMKNVKMREDFASQQLEMHKMTRIADHPRDFIDAYLNAMEAKLKKKESTTFEESQLRRSIQDLYIAGTETSSATLRWSLLFMVAYEDVQARVQSEIDHVIGKRFATMRDRVNMPYTEATIMECQRLGNIALFSVPRCTTADTKVNGHFVPKGTWVFVNRWGSHMNERYWRNPHIFDPTRFLTKDNKIYNPEAFVPFGIGPRSCLGASLARMELFLFFTSMLQTFKFERPDTSVPVDMTPRYGINMCPSPYQVIASHR